MQFVVPTGYLMQNGTRAVTIQGSADRASSRGGRYTGSIDDYIYRVIQELTGGRCSWQHGPTQRTRVNGIPASYVDRAANTSSGAVDVGVFAYQWDANTIYHFVMLTRAGQGIGPFASMVNSLRRITPAEAAAIRPKVIDVVTVQRGDTIQSLASRMAYRDFQLERFLSLNGLAANSPLVPGQKVKLVVYGGTSKLELHRGFDDFGDRACPTCRRRRRQASTSAPIMATTIKCDDQPIFNCGRTALVRAQATHSSG